MSGPVTTAIVLAAGRGTRLASSWPDLPKGFIEIAGEPLIERSLRLLRESGVRRIVIVAGYRADSYHDLATSEPGVEIVENPEFATTGSMASLACALDLVGDDFLLVESDLFFESRAIATLQEHKGRDVVLASAPTGATDEVWIEAPGGRLRQLTKDRAQVVELCGEFVGIVRISSRLARRMRDSYDAFVAANGNGNMSYDVHTLVEAAESHPVEVCVVPDLLWGEVDYDFHYKRLVDEIVPALRARDRAGEDDNLADRLECASPLPPRGKP